MVGGRGVGGCCNGGSMACLAVVMSREKLSRNFHGVENMFVWKSVYIEKVLVG